MKLKNKIAVITGASTGIGQAVSLEFAKEGASVFLVARSLEGLKKTQRLIRKSLGGAAEILTADLSDLYSINNLLSKIRSKTKKVDILANIAGVWHGKNEVYAGINLQDYDEKVIVDTYFVGIIAPTLLTHGLIPLMPKKGKIINLSGTFETGAKGWIPYYVSKRALEDLTVGLSQELKDKEIQVNCISPSDTATEAYKKYFPQYVKDAIDPEEIAKFAVYLCSKEANSISGKIFVLKMDRKPFESFHF